MTKITFKDAFAWNDVLRVAVTHWTSIGLFSNWTRRAEFTKQRQQDLFKAMVRVEKQ